MKFNMNLKIPDNQVKKVKSDMKKEIFSCLEILVFTAVFICIFMTAVCRMSPVVGQSMEPTLHEGDRLITTNIHGTFKHNDVVVVRRNGYTALVKRIIALEGEKVDVDFEAGKVYVNDKLINEPFINEPTHVRKDFKGPVVVPKGYVFVMGDNRNHSDDSRISKIGMIDKQNILGKVSFRVYPFNKFGKIK